jgi:hypothetical protein
MVVANLIVRQFNDLLCIANGTRICVRNIIIYLNLTPIGYFPKSLVLASYERYLSTISLFRLWSSRCVEEFFLCYTTYNPK